MDLGGLVYDDGMYSHVLMPSMENELEALLWE